MTIREHIIYAQQDYEERWQEYIAHLFEAGNSPPSLKDHMALIARLQKEAAAEVLAYRQDLVIPDPKPRKIGKPSCRKTSYSAHGKAKPVLVRIIHQ